MRSTLAIDGMFCGGCAATVERALVGMPGVQTAAVSFISDAAVVEHDTESAPVERLVDRVQHIGYSARNLDQSGGNLNAPHSRNAFQTNLVIRLCVAIALGMWVMLASIAGYMGQVPAGDGAWWLALATCILAIPVVLYSGSRFYQMAWRSVRVGAPGMDAMITLAVLAASVVSVANLALGIPVVYADAAVMLITFQLIARLTDFHVRRQATDAMRALLELAPDRAMRVPSADPRKSGGATEQAESVLARDLTPGDYIVCRAGERIAADGVVVDGRGHVDASVLTGESRPVPVADGNRVDAGCVVLDSAITVRVSAGGGHRGIDALAAEVRRLVIAKSALARTVDRIAYRVVPAMVLASVAAGALALFQGLGAQTAVQRALAVLVVTCPCALSLAIPLAVARTTAAARSLGAILRDPAAIEQAGSLQSAFIDKTGTLTVGQPRVRSVVPQDDFSPTEVLAIAAQVEANSTHPLARAIVEAADISRADQVSQAVERAGQGIIAQSATGERLLVGAADLLQAHGIQLPIHQPSDASEVWVARGEHCLGRIELADALRPGASDAIKRLAAMGINTRILSGDGPGPVQAVANALDVPGTSRCSPESKKQIIAARQKGGERVIFVGDGLNDGPALAAADIGVAVASATELARSASAIGLLRGGVEQLPRLVALLRRSRRILLQNLAWALIYNAILVPVAILGGIQPVWAAVAMVASTLSVLANSLRIRVLSRSEPEHVANYQGCL
nr:cation-translocating P-type ATPase [Oceanococcus sp. HetDA_MAG_MS8]